MGFFNTFLNVWQLRASIKIQESLEESVRVARENSETRANLPKIIDELSKKNESWDKEIKLERNKIGTK